MLSGRVGCTGSVWSMLVDCWLPVYWKEELNPGASCPEMNWALRSFPSWQAGVWDTEKGSSPLFYKYLLSDCYISPEDTVKNNMDPILGVFSLYQCFSHCEVTLGSTAVIHIIRNSLFIILNLAGIPRRGSGLKVRVAPFLKLDHLPFFSKERATWGSQPWTSHSS